MSLVGCASNSELLSQNRYTSCNMVEKAIYTGEGTIKDVRDINGCINGDTYIDNHDPYKARYWNGTIVFNGSKYNLEYFNDEQSLDKATDKIQQDEDQKNNVIQYNECIQNNEDKTNELQEALKDQPIDEQRYNKEIIAYKNNQLYMINLLGKISGYIIYCTNMQWMLV